MEERDREGERKEERRITSTLSLKISSFAIALIIKSFTFKIWAERARKPECRRQ